MANLSTFENPRLFSSNLLQIPGSPTSCSLITFLSAVQDLKIEILPLQWQSTRRLVGKGGTSQISQAVVNPETSIAFKRVSEEDRLRLDDEEILGRIVSEVLVLAHEAIRGRLNILELQGVGWDVSPFLRGKNPEPESTVSLSNTEVWPVLLFEMSRYGDLGRFAASPAGRSLDHAARLNVCLQVGWALATMHSNKVIHGDIKPQNIIMFRRENGSFTPKVADFGYSSVDQGLEVPICLPESPPWYAPELHEYPNFTLLQASRADIFSYGMLCLWFIFERYFSGDKPLAQASAAFVLKYTDGDENSSINNLAELRRQIAPLDLAEHLITATEGLDEPVRLTLQQFFHRALSSNPSERSIDISEVMSHLDEDNETARDEAAGFQYNPPLADDFHLSQSLHSLYSCDYRVRLHIVKCLEEIASFDPPDHLASQLGLCWAIGFGGSATAEEQDKMEEIAEISGFDIQKVLNEASIFIENAGELFATLIDSGYISDMESLDDLYREHNVLQDAINVIRHEFEGSCRVLGQENAYAITLAQHLSLMLHNDGKWEEAEKLAKYVVEAMEKKDHHHHHRGTLQSKLQLASINWSQGRWEDAEAIEQAVLDTCFSQYGKDDNLTLSCMASLTATYSDQGNWEKAERMGNEAMDIFPRRFGPEHPNTLSHMSVMAELYYRQAKFDEAINLQESIMETSRKALGDDHTDTIASLSSLAKMYWKYEIREEGAMLQMDAVDAATRLLGAKHPDTLTMMGSLANMYEETGEHEEAEKLQREILSARQQTMGAEHPKTLQAMTNLAFTLGGQDKFEESREIEISALEIMERVLGPNHPDTLTTMSNLAFTWRYQEENEKAVALMKECLRRQEQRLGPDHPDVLETMENLEEWQSSEVGDVMEIDDSEAEDI
ncbi:kinase-like domain-containing protein [Astrocystis sublimbata]|nr:kinase-like domain-containing protein [Astrocystis sublimbata]